MAGPTSTRSTLHRPAGGHGPTRISRHG